MEFKDSARIDQSRVRYGGSSRGRGGRRGVAVGGGAGGILLLLLIFLGPQLGIDPSSVLGGGEPRQQGGVSGEVANKPECKTGADVDRDPECRWPAYVTAIDGFWETQVQGYRRSETQLFSGRVETACGVASSQVGPFYCPGDKTVYIDTDYMGKLLDQLGAQGGYAAEAYIIAHEYGHHVQNLTGALAKSRQGAQKGAKSGSVGAELQADCYAGVWFHHTMRDKNSLIEDVTQDDLNRILDAARAVGDDHIQEQSMGQVIQNEWTHGSSEQRQRWLHAGFESGDVNSCDTFSTDNL